MRFCDKYGCNNVLSPHIKFNELLFICNICNEEYTSTSSDTLLVDEIIRETETLYKHDSYIKNAHDDTIAELIKKDCTNSSCDESIVHVIKIDKNGQSLYICPKCKNKFV